VDLEGRDCGPNLHQQQLSIQRDEDLNRYKKATKVPKNTLNRYWLNITAKDLYHDKEIVHREVFDQIWWDGVKAVSHGLPKTFQVWWTNYVSHFCGTNRQLSRINPSIKNICPSCGRCDESTQHVIRCKDSGRLNMLGLSIGIIINFLTNIRKQIQS